MFIKNNSSTLSVHGNGSRVIFLIDREGGLKDLNEQNGNFSSFNRMLDLNGKK